MTSNGKMQKNSAWPGLLALPFAALAAAILTASAYWPGLMTWDPVRQYGEALTGEIDDWHPPMMQWIWRQLIPLHPGPMPMLLLQLALYWGGLALLATTVRARGRPRLAWGLLACGLWPFGLALTGMILKDCLMAGALLVALGLLAIRQDRGSVAAAIGGAAMLVFAATLRFNAFTACLPLLIALLPRAWWSTKPRLLLAAIVGTIALMAAMPIANRLIGAEKSDVELSLVIFDLGGITEHGGGTVFPAALATPDLIAVNHRCYRPDKWDSYSDWVDPECPLGFSAWGEKVDDTIVRPYPFLARAILAHPIAYAEHRLTHFALNTRILPLADAIERPIPYRTAPNDWGFHITPNAATRALDALALALAHTPLGWPIVWIGLALGALLASWGLPAARLIAPIALSGFLYGCGYLVFSVASELRYHLWTALAALIALVLALSERDIRTSRRLIRAFAPALLAIAGGILVRAMAG
jgi:hypothetical protein